MGQFFVILASPFLARLFKPADFGQLQFVLSIALILGALSTLRFEMALPLTGRKSDAMHVLALALLLAFGTAVVVLALFWLNPQILQPLYKSSSAKHLIFFVPLILVFEAQNSIFNYWFTRTKDFKIPSLAKSFFGIFSATAQLLIALSGMLSGFGLLLGYFLGQIASVGWYLSNFVKQNFPLLSGSVTFKGMLQQAKIHKNFPLYSSWNVLLNTFSRNLPPLLLVSYFSVAEAGYFAIGIRLLNIPLNTLGMSVGQVYFQQIARYKEQGIPMMPLLASTALKLLALIVFPLAIIYFWGEQIFGLVFGHSWLMAGQIASILVPFYLMRFLASPISTVFAVMGKQYLGLIWQILYTAGTFGSFYFTRASHDFIRTIHVYSLVGAALFLLLLIMTLYTTWQADLQTRRAHQTS